MNLDTRDPDTLAGVTAEYVAALGKGKCQRVIGKADTALYQTANPTNGACKLTAADFVKLDCAMSAAGKHLPFARYLDRMTQRASGQMPTDVLSPIELTLEMGVWLGHMDSAVLEATHPQGPGGRKWTRNEYCAFKQLIEGGRKKLDELSVAVEKAYGANTAHVAGTKVSA